MRTRTRIIGAAILVATLCIFLTYVLWPRPKEKPLYRVIVLPSLGGPWTTPTAINNRGQVVGYSEAVDGSCHLCLWDPNGALQDLGPAISTRYYLNDVGQIAGTTRDPNGNHLAFIRDRARGVQILGTLGGTESMARGLNNLGQVVGWSRTAAGRKHAFVWDETAGMRDLGTPEGDEGEARAINDNGQIVGVSDEEAGRPALWTSSGPAPATGQFRGLFGLSDINNRGYMAGRQSFRDGRDFMVLWRPGGDPKKLFPIDHEIVCWPVINDANQILFAELRWNWPKLIDRTRFVPGTYYLWDPNRGRIPLNRHVLVKRGERLELFDLNDSGCMVGRVLGPGEASGRAVLLEPIPERWGK